MNNIIFEVIDKKGRKVVLTRERWKYILKHKGMEQHLEDMKDAIMNSTISIPHNTPSTKRKLLQIF